MAASPGRREAIALFEPDADFHAIIGRVEQAGVLRDGVTVCSPLPLEHLSPTRHRLLPYLIAIVAGLIGIGVGIFFAAGTAVLYPLMTGGKAIVAAPVVGIISYETMMLLAVSITFVTMVIVIVREARRTPHGDPQMADGKVALIVPLETHGQEAAILRILQQAGAGDITIRSSEQPPIGWEPQGQALPISAIFAVASVLLSGCSRDMQDQPSYQPTEAPRLHSPVGSIPQESRTVLSVADGRDGLDPAWGARLYRVNCFHCHGPTGEGNGPVAAYLKEKPANLRAATVQNRTHEELYRIVSQGKDVMPAFRGHLSADERWAVAQYVKSLAP
jgi:mono/diheme cytochrome c family protein